MRFSGGTFKNQTIYPVKGSILRPTSAKLRQTIFNICQRDFEGASVLDVCAGTGAIGLDALSYGASVAVFIDNNPHSIAAIRHTLQAVGCAKKATLLLKDALDGLECINKQGISFDLIYLDPPYRAIKQGEPLAIKLLLTIAELNLLSPNGHLFLETEILKVPPPPLIKNLTLYSSRRCGSSALWEYRNLNNFTKD